MCSDWCGFLGRGLVTSVRSCPREMEVCHHLFNLMLGLLELVGKLLICASQVCHHLHLVGAAAEFLYNLAAATTADRQAASRRQNEIGRASFCLRESLT